MSSFHSTSALWVALLLAGSAALAGGLQTLTPYEERRMAPDFVLEDADGATHRLSDYRGRVVALNFWASWCPPCWREMPSMQRLKNRLGDSGLVILAVNVGEDEETVFGFSFSLDEPIDFPLLLDLDGTVTERWPIVGLPTSFIIDKDGRVALRAVGGRLWDAPEFAEAVGRLLAAE